MTTTKLRVNGTTHEVDVDPSTPLIFVLRNQLGLTGAKLGCGLEQCGACAVLVDGEPVLSCVRGAHLAAMQKDGLKLLIDGEEHVAHPNATDDPATLGPQDIVIVTLKTHQGWDVAEQMTPLLGDDTAVVTCQNGIPWWYFYNLNSQYRDLRLSSVDPGDRQWA